MMRDSKSAVSCRGDDAATQRNRDGDGVRWDGMGWDRTATRNITYKTVEHAITWASITALYSRIEGNEYTIAVAVMAAGICNTAPCMRVLSVARSTSVSTRSDVNHAYDDVLDAASTALVSANDV